MIKWLDCNRGFVSFNVLLSINLIIPALENETKMKLKKKNIATTGCPLSFFIISRPMWDREWVSVFVFSFGRRNRRSCGMPRTMTARWNWSSSILRSARIYPPLDVNCIKSKNYCGGMPRKRWVVQECFG